MDEVVNGQCFLFVQKQIFFRASGSGSKQAFIYFLLYISPAEAVSMSYISNSAASAGPKA